MEINSQDELISWENVSHSRQCCGKPELKTGNKSNSLLRCTKKEKYEYKALANGTVVNT